MGKSNLLNYNSLNINTFSNENSTTNLSENLFDALKSNNESITLDIAKKMIHEIDAFNLYSRNKKSKKIFFPNSDLPFKYLFPYYFSSIKESCYWKRKETKSIQPNDIDKLDLSQIHIVKWPNNLTKFEIIEELRNAIQHWKIVYNENDTIFIDNPSIPKKHPFHFKAAIPYIIFDRLMHTITTYERRLWSYDIDCHSFSHEDYNKDIDLWLSKIQLAIHFIENDSMDEYPYYKFLDIHGDEFMRATKYKDISDKIKFKSHFFKDGLKDPVINWKSFSETYEYVKKHPNIRLDESYDKKTIELTDNQKQIIEDFFSLKKHKLSEWTLQYITNNLVDNREQNFISLIYEFRKADKDAKYYDILCNYCKKSNLYHEILGYYSNNKTASWKFEILNSLMDNVNNWRQKNWLPLIFHDEKIIYYLVNELKNLGFKYDKKNNEYKKWDLIFTVPDFFGIYRILVEYWTDCRYTIGSFQNRLKIMFTKIVYISCFNKFLDVNSGVEWQISEAEHTRNALVHNTYTLLDWIDYILLRDWYNKKTNSWSREKKISINDIYQKCVNVVIKN